MTVSTLQTLVLALTTCAGLLIAADKQPPAEDAAPPPACQEWSDGCRVCSRTTTGAPACSTPGIACQPGPVVCRTPPDKG